MNYLSRDKALYFSEIILSEKIQEFIFANDELAKMTKLCELDGFLHISNEEELFLTLFTNGGFLASIHLNTEKIQIEKPNMFLGFYILKLE